MGKVIVKLSLTNHGDAIGRARGWSQTPPRQIAVDALVDTGATRLYLKPSVIEKLGLRQSGQVLSATTNGPKPSRVFEPVRLDLMERWGICEVVEVPEDVPNLLGQIPLEHLDFVVDPNGGKLTPNPEHDGQWMSEEY